MVDERTTATLPPEGVTSENVSQLTQPPAEAVVEPKTEAAVKVETPETKPTSTSERKDTLRPSDHYAIRGLKKQIKDLEAKIAAAKVEPALEQKPSEPKSTKTYRDSFYDDPPTAVETRAREIAKEALAEFVDKQKQESLERESFLAMQEAEKLLDAHPSSNDPNFLEELIAIGKEIGVNRWINSDPVGGFKIMIREYDKVRKVDARPKIGLVPTKGQLAPVATGVPPAGQKPVLKDELNNMARELQKDPTLARDPEWLSKWDRIKKAA